MRIFASRLFKSVRSAEPAAERAWTIPAGRRVYAVGDIHGRLDLTEQLIGMIEQDDAERGAAETMIVFLGDLVDRGPDSCGVIDFLMRYREGPRECVFLAGNHDEIFARAASGDREAAATLHRMGGRETALSYGISGEEYDRGDYGDLAALLAERVPAAHTRFMRSWPDWHQIGDYVFVHAGIKPDRPMSEQRPGDLRWIRSAFLGHEECHGIMVVHGHTITEGPDIRSNRIGIDTGAYRTGKLTALGLEGSERWMLST
ncbi:MAG: serine/threonine protein phosphatase [Sphingomonas bacterium]|nr:serine/threonine protein phosphatase [Sphingomonas bacterium]